MNQVLFGTAPIGARIADRVTGFMGSWHFLVIQSVIVVVWLSANMVLLTRPFDPYPFILLNLAFSTQAPGIGPSTTLRSVSTPVTRAHVASKLRHGTSLSST